jgi:hypothetical protein
MKSSQPSFLILAKLGLKNQRKTMQIKNDGVAPVTLCDEFPARRLCSATTNRSGDSHEIESVILIGY